MKKLLFILFVASVSVSCSKKDDPQPSTPSLSASSTPQVSCTIDGTAFTMVSDGSIIEAGDGSANILQTYPDTSIGVYESFIYNNQNSVSFGVDRAGLKFVGFPPTDAAFNNFFPAGTYPYTYEGYNGVRISYRDASGTDWTTDSGTANQSGSAFKIDDRKAVTYGSYYVLFKASFNCKLYNGLGQVKVVTNGVYIGSFENI